MSRKTEPGCESCKHWGGGLACKAYPMGIPLAIQSGEHDHRDPYPGDNGIRYEPVEEADQ